MVGLVKESRKTSNRNTRSESRKRRRTASRRIRIGFAAVVLLICGLMGLAAALGGAVLSRSSAAVAYEIVNTNRPLYAGSPLGAEAAASPLSPVFTQEVQYWSPLIKAWGVVYQVDPNLIATVIQIESCGDPLVSSPAGAQGLFQVMPFHFAEGEDMLDVQTNAQRGLAYLLEGLERADGHVGLALAGYNGGHGIIERGWASWTVETRRYYYWGSRIYSEAIAGMSDSPTLQEWLNMGGHRLCTQAQQHQQLLESEQARSAVAVN
jgi:hypothetical protein